MMNNIVPGLNNKLIAKVVKLNGMSSVEATQSLAALEKFTTTDFRKIR